MYDGHGGSKAAAFVAENLHLKIFEMLESISENQEKEAACKAGYLKTDEEFLKQVSRFHFCNENMMNFCTKLLLMKSIICQNLMEINPVFSLKLQGLDSGACCVTALIDGKEMVVSNLGDCRAVLCMGGGSAEALTTDHRPTQEEERRRIEDKVFSLLKLEAFRLYAQNELSLELIF